MAVSLNSIKAPINDELSIFESRFRELMRSKVALLDKITYYIVKHKGKQMRPMFVLLSAGLVGEINDKTYRGAALVELLHTATLVHDDVVDDAHLRRGMFSINALWKNKIAVLVGDYLLSRGLLLAVDQEDFDSLKIVSSAVKEMSEGELLQMEKARKLDITEETYFKIIQQKTATLIRSACEMGVNSVAHSEDDMTRIQKFGEITGLAFQIKDDLFDYGAFKTGKPSGIDIQEKKMTLPLIYALSQVSSSEKSAILKLLKSKKVIQSSIDTIIEFVKKNGGIQYAQDKMMQLREEAISLLHQFPKNPFRDSLEDMLIYTTDRKK